eukprot:Selendium_serpulae@DN5782_c0_g2_i2.p1
MRQEADLPLNSGRLRVRVVDVENLNSTEHLLEDLAEDATLADYLIIGEDESAPPVSAIGQFYLLLRLLKAVAANGCRVITVLPRRKASTPPPITEVNELKKKWMVFDLAKSFRPTAQDGKALATEQDRLYHNLLKLSRQSQYPATSPAVAALRCQLLGRASANNALFGGAATEKSNSSSDKHNPAYWCQPENVSTEVWRHLRTGGYGAMPAMKCILRRVFFKTPFEASQTQMYLACEDCDKLTEGGVYSEMAVLGAVQSLFQREDAEFAQVVSWLCEKCIPVPRYRRTLENL